MNGTSEMLLVRLVGARSYPGLDIEGDVALWQVADGDAAGQENETTGSNNRWRVLGPGWMM